MNLFERIKSMLPDDPDTLLAKAAKEATEAALRAKFADEAYKEALLAEDDSTDSKARAFADKLEKDWQAAKREVVKKNIKLAKAKAGVDAIEAEARAQAQEAEEAARKAAMEAPFLKVDELAHLRTEKSTTLELAAKAFAAAYLDFALTNTDLLNAVTAIDSGADVDSMWLGVTHVETAVRKELFRLDVKWASLWMLDKSSIPNFTSQFAERERMLRRWRKDFEAQKDLLESRRQFLEQQLREQMRG